MSYIGSGDRYKKDDGHSSMGKAGGKKKLIKPMSRWTFFLDGKGLHDKQPPLYCNICKERVHKLSIAFIEGVKIEVCDKCNERDKIYDYLKNKDNREEIRNKG